MEKLEKAYDYYQVDKKSEDYRIGYANGYNEGYEKGRAAGYIKGVKVGYRRAIHKRKEFENDIK